MVVKECILLNLFPVRIMKVSMQLSCGAHKWSATPSLTKCGCAPFFFRAALVSISAQPCAFGV